MFFFAMVLAILMHAVGEPELMSEMFVLLVTAIFHLVSLIEHQIAFDEK